MKFINVRGCNGSGKTTLLRDLVWGRDCEVIQLVVHHTVKDKSRPGNFLRVAHPHIPVTFVPERRIAILGDYSEAAAGATTAGCDRIKTQEAAKNALEAIAKFHPPVEAILFEGVVISTIFGPWAGWAERNGGMVWAFLNTPLDVCLDRIQKRNGGKPIKEDQVAAKHATIARVRTKALEAGYRVADIDWQQPEKCLETILACMGDGPGEEDGPWTAAWAERSGEGN